MLFLNPEQSMCKIKLTTHDYVYSFTGINWENNQVRTEDFIRTT